MIALALIALAAATHIQIVDEVVAVPPGEWRYVELGLKQRPGLIAADFETRGSSPAIRLLLVRREDLDRLRDEPATLALAATAPGASGLIRYHVRIPGSYLVVMDNRASEDQPAEVHLRVSLDFGGRLEPHVTTLSPTRQLAVIAISFAVFFAIVSYSARRLLRGIKQ